VISFMRTATRNTELAGQAIREGDPVLMLYASANRDDRQFGRTADRFDVGRDPNQHVAFGFGTHFCIGATLARIETRVLLEELLDRFETVELVGDVERSHSSVIAGVKRAPLVFR
jgi:cytochrome P450